MGLYRQANGDYAKMKNISQSNLMNSISRDGKTNIEALNAMLKSSDNINGVSLNDFLGSLGAKDRVVAEANLIKGLMDKNSVNGVVDFRALNESLAKLDFQSEFAKELTSQILSKKAILNNTSDILNSLGSRVVKSKGMSQGISADPLKRAETMKANFIVEKLKPLIPYLGNNEALKLHLNRAILNANGDFKLAIKNIDNIPDGNLPTPTRNLLNEFKNALKDIEQVVKTQEPTTAKAENQANLANQSIKGDGFVTYPNSARQIYPHNAIFEVPNEIKQIVDIGDRVSASLEWLRSNHPEMFKTQRAVKEVIDYVLKEPENIVSPKKGDGVILSKQNDKKIDEIGINQNSEVFHANKRKLNSNEKKAVSGDALPPHLDADNISLTGRYSVGEKSHLTAFDRNIIPQNAKNEVKVPTQSTQINEQIAKQEPQKATNEAQQFGKTEQPQAQTKEQELIELAKTLGVYNENYSVERLSQRVKDQLETNAHIKEIEINAINKIEALNNFKMENTGEKLQRKKILTQAEQELKEFAKSIGTSDEKLQDFNIKNINDLREQINGLSLYLSKTKNEKGEALANKYNKILVDMDSLNIDRTVNRSQQKEQYEALKKEAVAAISKLGNTQLHTVSLLAARHGKTDDFLTKNLTTKDELNKARELLQKDQKINPIKEFGTNYAEFYHDGANAIRKLLVERQGQVAGAFERKELGDIDLVWGEAKAANGDIKGYGLSKIEAKHLNDFASFYGDIPQEKLINGLNEIIKNGKIINENGVDTIWYKKDNDYYLIGLSKGFYNKGDNNWIITVYEKTNLSIDKKARIDKALKGGDSKTISAYAEIKSSKTPKLTTAE
ncbi:hypothetical protein CSUIS19072_06480, partial [Campylobacter sp. RM19072]|nr:hypothetical protein [Campylobacter sp. RM19072]